MMLPLSLPAVDDRYMEQRLRRLTGEDKRPRRGVKTTTEAEREYSKGKDTGVWYSVDDFLLKIKQIPKETFPEPECHVGQGQVH